MKMMKKNAVRIGALLIVMIITLMPVSSAVVLSNLRVTGTDGIDGVVRQFDTPSVSVQVADMSNTTNIITQLTFSTPYAFNALPTSCDGNTCYYTTDGPHELLADQYTAIVNYPGATPISTTFVADGDGPRTVSLDVVQVGELVKAIYSVHDPEYAGTNSGTCSGIDKIEFYVDGSLVETVEVVEDGKVCEYEGEITLPIGTNGLHEIFIKAYDALGLTKTSSSVTIETDFTPPVIDSTYKIMKEGQELSYIRTAGGVMNDVVVVFDIIEQSDLKLVKADLSDLREDVGYDNAAVLPSPTDMRNICSFTTEESRWTCQFYVDIMPETVNPQIHVTVEDDYGIVMEKSLTGDFSIDNEEPTISLLGTTLTYEAVSYVKDGTVEFTAKLFDAGSGFRNNYAEHDGGKSFFFDLSDFNTDWSKIPAKNCTKSGSNWECSVTKDLSGTSLENGGLATIDVHVDSADDAGNIVSISETFNGTVVMDNMAPYVFNKTVFETVGGRVDWLQEGDNLAFVLTIVEDEGVILAENAFADFSLIVSEEPERYKNVTATSCIDAGNTIVDNNTGEELTAYSCRWEVENVGPTGAYQFDKVEFEVSDVAGNKMDTFEFFVWILTLSDEDNPNYVVYGAGDPEPKKIDRRAIALVDYGVWVPIFITDRLDNQYGKNITPVRVELTGCSESLNRTNMVEDPGPMMFGDSINIWDFLLYVEFKKGEYVDIDTINLECKFDVVSRVGYTVSNIENETIHINVSLFDSKYDPLDEAFLKKIKDSTYLMGKWLNWVEMLHNLIKNLRGICTLGATMTNLERVLSDVDTLVFDAATLLWFVSPDYARGLWDLMHNKMYCPLKDMTKSRTLGLDYLVDKAFPPKEGEQGYLRKACSYLSCSNGCWYGKGPEVDEKVNTFISEKLKFGTVAPFVNQAAKHVFQGMPTKQLKCGKVGILPEDPWTLEQMGMPTMNTMAPGIDSSIYMAMACGCVPAIIDYLHKMRAIECKYIRCMSEMSVMGAPYYQCEVDKDTEYCKYIVGPFLDVIPNPFAYIQDVLDWVKSSLEERPLKWLTEVTGPACKAYLNATRTVKGCNTEFNPGNLGVIVPYMACAYAEADAKVMDLQSMGVMIDEEGEFTLDPTEWDIKAETFFKLKDLKWESDKTYTCKQDDIQNLMDELAALD